MKTERLEVETIKLGQCEEVRKTDDNKCSQTCTYDTDEDVPVCGDDGVMYPNKCTFDLAVCKFPDLKLLGDGSCQENDESDNGYANDDDSFADEDADKAPICSMVCQKIYYPVCGTDRKTYSNKCMLDLASCEQKKPIAEAFSGRCEEKLMHNGKCRKFC